MTVRKAVIPAAGLGTRFLPASKSIPKEMLPLVDRPTIEYVVEEAVRAGIRDILVVNGRGKGPIEDHFDRAPELEAVLEQKGKHELLKQVQALAMIEIHDREQASVIALLEVQGDEISSYGSAEVEAVGDDVFRLKSVVEKPKPADAPSNLAVIGRYVLRPAIFDALDRIEPGAGGELQLTDAIGVLVREETVLGRRFTHGRYDAGMKVDYLRANLELALDRPDLADDVEAMIAEVVRRRGLV